MSEQERIIELLEEISKDLKKVLCSQEAKCLSPMDDPKNWLTSEETMKILRVCKRTLYNLREKDKITWKLAAGNQHRYYAPDLFKIRDRYLK